MRRSVSKRRWIARYRMGKPVTREAIENHRGLWERMNKIGKPEKMWLTDHYKLSEANDAR